MMLITLILAFSLSVLAFPTGDESTGKLEGEDLVSATFMKCVEIVGFDEEEKITFLTRLGKQSEAKDGVETPETLKEKKVYGCFMKETMISNGTLDCQKWSANFEMDKEDCEKEREEFEKCLELEKNPTYEELGPKYFKCGEDDDEDPFDF